MTRGQTVLQKKKKKKSEVYRTTIKKEFVKKNKNYNNSFEYHDLEIYVVDNDAEVVSEKCHWLRNRLIAFVGDVKATLQISFLL